MDLHKRNDQFCRPSPTPQIQNWRAGALGSLQRPHLPALVI